MADEFSAQAGSLKERAFVEIGKVKGIEIKIVKVTDIISQKAVSALRFQYEVKETYGSDTKLAGLDADEIDGLVKSIKALQDNVFPTTRTTYTEVTYKSRSGFEAGAYYDVPKSKWNCYVQIEKHDRKSLVFLNTEDFGTLLSLVLDAKGKM